MAQQAPESIFVSVWFPGFGNTLRLFNWTLF